MDEKKKVNLLARVGHGANDMYFFTFPSVLPLILAQFGFSYTAAGGYLTAFLCTVALFSFLFGKLADSFPRWLFLSGGFFVASLGLIIAGFMPRFWLFMLFLLVTAVGVSTYHPVVYAVIEERTLQRRGHMFAMFEIFGAVGVLILFLLHGTLLTTLGWKTVVIITSIPGFAVGTLFAVHRGAVDGKPTPQSKSTPVESVSSTPFSVFLVFFVSIILRILCFAAVWNFMPTFLVDAIKLKSSIASFVTGFLFIGGILVNLFAGRLADRLGPITVVIGASVLSGIFVLLATYATAAWMLPIILIFMGAGVSSAIPAQNLILSILSRRGRKGEAYGVMMGIITTAISLAPLIFGVLADNYGLKAALRLISIPVWLSCFLLLAMLRVPGLKNAVKRETAG